MKKFCLLVFSCVITLCLKAQWTNNTDIYNTNTGNVGIGTTSPAYKLDVSGQARIDAGSGTGPILRLRTNNGSGYFYADASSDLHWTQRFHVDQPFFPDGGLQFNAFAVGIALNGGPISGISRLSFNQSYSNIKMYNDYNAFQLAEDQGIIVKYGSRGTGNYPRAVYQAYKDGDPTENPFLISAQGFGWLKNSKTDEVAWIVKAATSQTSDIQQWQNGSGNVLANVTAAGNLGIGVTNPWAKLDVRTTGANGADQNALNIQNPSTAAYSTVSMQLSSGATSFSTISNQRDNLGSGSTLILQTTDNSGTIQPRMYINKDGGVGIGSQNYPGKLTVTSLTQGDGIWVAGSGNSNVALLNNMTPGSWNAITQNGDKMILWKGSSMDNTDAGGLVLGPWSNTATGMRIGSNGNVGIGTNKTAGTDYKLYVELGIRTRKIKVDQTTWADYVFETDYDLPTLNEVEQFIQNNKHLPGVASAKEVREKGLDLGENQAVLLKKIEELTLYVIQLQKEMDELKKKIK